MTNKEAIELIDDRMCWGRGRWSKHHLPEIDEYWQAGLMAIEALKAQDAKPTPSQLPSGDTIYRQDAMDAIFSEPLYESGMKKRDADAVVPAIYEKIKSLPSAQPKGVIPHRNYKYLSDYWCECGWHLGKKGEVKYCSECGRKVNWDG